jgi:hypothetical protein
LGRGAIRTGRRAIGAWCRGAIGAWRRWRRLTVLRLTVRRLVARRCGHLLTVTCGGRTASIVLVLGR